MQPTFSIARRDGEEIRLILHRNHPSRVKPVLPLTVTPFHFRSCRADYLRRGISLPIVAPAGGYGIRLRGHKNRQAREQAAARNRAQGILA